MRVIIPILSLAFLVTSCSGVDQSVPEVARGQEIFVFDNGDVSVELVTTTATPPQSSTALTTPMFVIGKDGEATFSRMVTVSTVQSDFVPAAGLSPLQEEVIFWRTFQRQASVSNHGETPEESACAAETMVLLMPEDLLPQLTNPAREELTEATLQRWFEAAEEAKARCVG